METIKMIVDIGVTVWLTIWVLTLQLKINKLEEEKTNEE